MKLVNDTITVYNTYLDIDGLNVYVGTVIKGVHWFMETISNVTNDGLKSANRYTIRIPADADFSGKTYVSPIAYKKAADHDGIFTFAQGDVIVLGIAPLTITKPRDLFNTYDEAVTVLGVTDNRRAPQAKHWKVVGS